MPNWCENILVVEGEKAQVQRFIAENGDAFATEENARLLSFEMAVPTRAKQEGDREDYWYDLHISNWGTKWDAASVQEWELNEYREGLLSARCEFDTAWAPPIKWLEVIGDRYPQLMVQLDYVEHGNGECGTAIAEGGSVSVDEKHYDPADYSMSWEDDEEDVEEE